MSEPEARPETQRGSGVPRIAICACTYRRPKGLTRLLEGLAHLQFQGDRPDATVIIVDNDPDGSARSVVEAAQPGMPWSVRYVHEPTPGIPHARNAALDAVGAEIDWVCFLDDDETPDPQWLAELLNVQQRYEADVVTGPVLPVFEQPAPRWAQRGGFFRRARHETGVELPYAFTNNVMFRAQLVRDMNLRFETRYQPFGEDRAFFRRLAIAGATIVWADRAIVNEWIPPDRVDPDALIRRMYHIGRSNSQMERAIVGGAAVFITQLAKGIVWIAIGLVSVPASLLGKHFNIRARRWLKYGAGLIAGLHVTETDQS